LDKIAKLKQAPVQPPPLESFPKVGYCQDCGEPAPSASKTSKAIDFSSIDPEKEWECFGTIVKDHPECKECPFAVKCEEKKNSKAKK
jgi:hypothetical protein